MSIIKKLQAIQSELEVPKNQYNAFGEYHYRSGEDIFAAVKPLCIKHECLLTVTDEIVMLGDRYYVKATARLAHNGEKVETTAYAREQLEKKKMDAAQITGSASSYARKYALNGLFCLDDVKDADHGQPDGNGKAEKNKPATSKDAEEVFNTEVTPDDEKYINSQEPPEDTGGKVDAVRSECEVCSKQMTRSQVELSKHKYGKILCPEHQKEAANE